MTDEHPLEAVAADLAARHVDVPGRVEVHEAVGRAAAHHGVDDCAVGAACGDP